MKNDPTFKRIAAALEKIAQLMENAEMREINAIKKTKTTESKSAKALAKQKMISESMKDRSKKR